MKLKRRNIAVCILLSIITGGVYGIYWMIALNHEANCLSGKQGTSGGMVFLFTLITCGFYVFYWMYQMGTAVQMIHRANNDEHSDAPIVYLLLSLFCLSIVAYALLQNELNRYNTNA